MWGLSSSFEAEMKALLPRLDDDSQQSLGGSVSKHKRKETTARKTVQGEAKLEFGGGSETGRSEG